MYSGEKLLWNHAIICKDDVNKNLQIYYGDICELSNHCDLLVRSAFKNDYYPEIDLKNQGCWVSHPIEGNFRRIACVELLEYSMLEEQELADSITLTNTFSTLRILLEEITKNDKTLKNIVLPNFRYRKSGNRNLLYHSTAIIPVY